MPPILLATSIDRAWPRLETGCGLRTDALPAWRWDVLAATAITPSKIDPVRLPMAGLPATTMATRRVGASRSAARTPLAQADAHAMIGRSRPEREFRGQSMLLVSEASVGCPRDCGLRPAKRQRPELVESFLIAARVRVTGHGAMRPQSSQAGVTGSRAKPMT